MHTRNLFLASLLFASPLLAQDKPTDTSQDIDHMQHGGFMQGGMHHAIAKGVKLEQKIDGHTIVVRIGPMNLPDAGRPRTTAIRAAATPPRIAGKISRCLSSTA